MIKSWIILLVFQIINDDNECFKWSIVRYLNSADPYQAIVTKADKELAKKLDFKDIKISSKLRDIHKIEKMTNINISFFVYDNKQKPSNIFIKKCCFKVSQKTCCFIINKSRRKKTLWFYQRFQYFHVRSYFTSWKKTFFSFSFTSF